jgi:hypothetical protein
MIQEDEPTHSAALAEAIVAAVERADLGEHNSGLADLRNELPVLAEDFDSDRLKTILVATGCSCARDLATTWIRLYPDDNAPIRALDATQAWLAEPSQDAAALSAALSSAALQSFARTKGGGRLQSWPAHAWFARTCAWLADAPQYGWQAVAALLGLVRAGVRQSLVTQLAAQLRQAHERKG